MIANKTVAVIGGGISSLSMLLNIAQKINSSQGTIKVKLFEKRAHLGGRISTEESPEDQEHHTICADFGANYIDYENEQQKNFLEANLPKNLLINFKSFEGKLYIYENSKLREADYQKTRYYYQSGFSQMAADWKKQIQSQKTLDFAVISQNEVQKIELQNNKWKLKLSSEKKENQTQLYDILVFGTPAPLAKNILERSSIPKTQSLLAELGKINYTQQLSAVFELDQVNELKSTEAPYSILFKNHDLTFICFHQQKYPQNQKNIAVIQTSEQLTSKYAKKLSPDKKEVQLSHNQIQNQIADEIFNLIPQEIRQRYKFTKKCLGVHYWPQSLLKTNGQTKLQGQMFNRLNRELNADFLNEKGKRILYFTGDYLNNKSRVTGAMAVGIKLSQQLIMEHFQVDTKKSGL